MNKRKLKKIINDTRMITRRIFLICLDNFLISLSFVFSILLINKEDINNSFSLYSYSPYFIAFLLTLTPLYIFFGKYKGITRYTNSKLLYKLTFINIFLVFLIFCIDIFFFKNFISDYSFWIIFWLILNSITTVSTLLIRDFLNFINDIKTFQKKKVVIFGAGSAGAKLSEFIFSDSTNSILSFLDDNPNLWGRTIHGISINPPQYLFKIKKEVDKILIAIPSLNPIRRKEILNFLQKFDIPVMQIPSLVEILSGENQINKLRPIEIEDLLGRDIVIPDEKLIKKVVENSTICVTGAGGSIGSILCQQIIKLSPRKIIIIDNSEPSLYKIEKTLKETQFGSKVQCILGDVTEFNFIDQLISKNNIEVIFHAAAYKHVPIVEANPINGIFNNIISTEALCKASYKNNVKQLVMVSTDKAVRPTNIMGASKRLCEIIVQGYAEKVHNNNERNTLFSMVRFGNVIGSSGSVVPLFEDQIANGGPITITNPKMVRFFMSINEATQLILQSASLAKGGDVFLLDMGEPQNIKNLAIQMIKLNGLTVKDDKNVNGDIEIIYTGLRPGEKLYEEVLIDAESLKTEHPLIYRAIEKSIPSKELFPKINDIKNSLLERDTKKTISLMSKLIPEWQMSQEIINLIER